MNPKIKVIEIIKITTDGIKSPNIIIESVLGSDGIGNSITSAARTIPKKPI
jgi:hypothetical protein